MTLMPHLMIDLETMGNGPAAAIVSIGAVYFDDCGRTGDEFYNRVSLDSYLQAGLTVDASTIAWWMKQNDQARREISGQDETYSIQEALKAFSEFVGSNDPFVWGNGSDFDNVILGNAFRTIGLPIPWSFYKNRCYRTLKSLFPEIDAPSNAGAHNALNDAEKQALHASRILAICLNFAPPAPPCRKKGQGAGAPPILPRPYPEIVY